MRGNYGVSLRRGRSGTDPYDIVPGAAFGAEGAYIGRDSAASGSREQRELPETAGEPEGGLDRSGRGGGPAGAHCIGKELDALAERSLGQEPFSETVSEIDGLGWTKDRSKQQYNGQDM